MKSKKPPATGAPIVLNRSKVYKLPNQGWRTDWKWAYHADDLWYPDWHHFAGHTVGRFRTLSEARELLKRLYPDRPLIESWKAPRTEAPA